MRSSALVVAAIVMGLVGVADAKRLACWPSLQMHEVGGLRAPNPDDRTAPVTPVIRDAAGNVSSATEVMPYRYRRCGCGGGAMVLIVLAPVVLVGGAVALLVLCMLRRRRLRRPAEPVSLLVAESITRTILQRNVIALGAGIAAVIVLHMLDRWGSAALTSIVPLTAFTRVFAARRVLAALERDDAVAALHGTQLQVGMRDIQASNGLIERARKHRVPAGFARDI